MARRHRSYSIQFKRQVVQEYLGGARRYRFSAKISTEMQQRQEGLPKQIVDIGQLLIFVLHKKAKKHVHTAS